MKAGEVVDRLIAGPKEAASWVADKARSTTGKVVTASALATGTFLSPAAVDEVGLHAAEPPVREVARIDTPQRTKQVKVEDTNPFFASELKKLGIKTQSALISLAKDKGFLPVEDEDAKFSLSQFTTIADQADFESLRQYFSLLQILKNDGYFSMDDVHQVVEQTSHIDAMKALLYQSAGARREATVIHGLEYPETMRALRTLRNEFDFPLDDFERSQKSYDSFVDHLRPIVNSSLKRRGLYKAAVQIILANRADKGK